MDFPVFHVTDYQRVFAVPMSICLVKCQGVNNPVVFAGANDCDDVEVWDSGTGLPGFHCIWFAPYQGHLSKQFKRLKWHCFRSFNIFERYPRPSRYTDCRTSILYLEPIWSQYLIAFDSKASETRDHWPAGRSGSATSVWTCFFILHWMINKLESRSKNFQNIWNVSANILQLHGWSDN